MSVQIGSKGLVHFGDNMDAVHGVPSLERDSVALVFTSPPYWDYMDYGEGGSGTEGSYELYQESLTRLWAECFDKVIPGGAMVVNASNMTSRKEQGTKQAPSFLYPIVFDIARHATECGWTLFADIVWVKHEHTVSSAMGGKALFGSYPYPPTPKLISMHFLKTFLYSRSPASAPSPRAPRSAQS